MKVLLTGGAGYLGSVLVGKLLEEGMEVTVLDNFLYNKNSLDGYKKDIEIVEGDIRDMRLLSKNIRDKDAVIHLAAIVGDQASDLDKKTSVEVNYITTKVIAELCNVNMVPRLLFASSCSVYGERPGVSLMDETCEMKPISLYGETKTKSEAGIKQVYTNFNPTVMRLGTLFGLSPRMRFDLAINMFIAKGMTGEKITVFGGNQWRPFLHIQDAAEGFVTAIKKNITGDYNLSWSNLQIIEIAKEIADHFGVEVEINEKVTDARDYKVSTEKINKFGIKPWRNVKFAIREIEDEFKRGTFGDWKQDIYSDYKHLFNSEEAQSRIYTSGAIPWKSNEK